MRSTLVVAYAFATAAFFYAFQDAFGLGLRFTSLAMGFTVGLASAIWHTRGGRP